MERANDLAHRLIAGLRAQARADDVVAVEQEVRARDLALLDEVEERLDSLLSLMVLGLGGRMQVKNVLSALREEMEK